MHCTCIELRVIIENIVIIHYKVVLMSLQFWDSSVTLHNTLVVGHVTIYH